MSMRETLFGDYPIPDDTRLVAQAAFPKGNLYLQLRDRFGMVYTNQRFAHLFAQGGKPALAPARLALVLCLQFIEDLSDQQAADAYATASLGNTFWACRSMIRASMLRF